MNNAHLRSSVTLALSTLRFLTHPPIHPSLPWLFPPHLPVCSTILPVPYAFSKLGVATGVLTMALVAFVNDCTCCMMIRAAAATGRTTYEELAEWVGGRKAKVRPQMAMSVWWCGSATLLGYSVVMVSCVPFKLESNLKLS